MAKEKAPRILVIDDNLDDRVLIERELQQALPDVILIDVATQEQLEAAIAQGFDAAITDYQVRFATGLEIFRRLRAERPECPVIMFTASGSEEMAVEALKEGLSDYITKTPKHYPRIPHALNAALQATHNRNQLRATQTALAERADELAAILSAAPAAILVTYDAATSQVVFNAYAAQMLGIPATPGAALRAPATDLLGQFVVLNRDGAELSPEQFPVHRAARGEAIQDEEITLAFRDGRKITLFGNGRTLRDASQRPRGAVFAAIDVTALREADRRKDEFLATLAHELRNPMAPIRYAAAMLRENVTPAVLAQVRATIERQAAQMARLLDDLLDISRITRNVIGLQCEPMNFSAVVQEAVETARPAIARMKQDVKVSLPRAPVWVEADMTRLLQIIGNLLDNAVKYTPIGGKITVSLHQEAGAGVLRICDTGIGIAEEMMPKVFELFSQAHQGMAGAKGGLGIGLALVRRLVELHGGNVEAYSDGPGRGAEFVVHLPLAAPPANQAVTELETVRQTFRGRPRILVVDDHEDNADSLAALLRNHGLEVHVAYDGGSALRIADDIKPGIVVLDIGLPDINGAEVAKRLRERSWAATATLLAVSGWGQHEDRQRTFNAGVDAHLVKPIDPQELLRYISAAAAKSDAESEDKGDAPAGGN